MRTVLPAFALVAVLVMMLAVTVWGWGAAAPHAEESWQAAIPDTQPYLPTDGVRQVLDMAASALLPGYAFAQTSDTTPPTFVSSALDVSVLTITFSETIDAANIVPTKIHIRESGNYTHGVTLSAGELDTVDDGATISFTLTISHFAAVAGLATPELTIEPGAVRDESGNLIVGAFDASTRTFVDATPISDQELRLRQTLRSQVTAPRCS